MDDATTAAAPAATDSGSDAALDAFLRPAAKPVEAPAAEAPPAVPTEPAAAAPVEPAKPAEPAKEGDPEARARKILAAAEAKQLAAENFPKTFAANLRKDVHGELAKIGMTVDDIIDLSVGQKPAERPAAEPAATPEEDPEITDLKKWKRDQQAKEQDAAIAAKRSEIHGNIAKDARFPTINARGADGHEIVTEFMVSYFELHKARIDWDKAAAIVEKDLRGPTPAAAPARPTPAPSAAAPATTLTNDDVRDYVPPSEDEIPDVIKNNPDKLIAFLVADAERKTAARS